MWFVIIYHSMLPIRKAQRFISSLISYTHHGSVRGAENKKYATQMPHHQGSVGRWALRVSRPRRAAEKATINMNKICHLVIHGINPCLDDGCRINVICRAEQKTEPDGTFVQNHQLQPVWLGCDPRTALPSVSAVATQQGETFTSRTIMPASRSHLRTL